MGITITVNGLKMCYETQPVLDGTNFEVQKGDMVALLGANGSGKSTLLRCISRVLKPSQGDIFFDTKKSQHMSTGEAARTMAVVPQEANTDFE